MNSCFRSLIVSLVVAGPATQALQAADVEWPQFRGPLALGTADNPDLPDTWSATDNVLWKHDIAGRGWSSPIVWRNHVFVTTVTSDDEPAGKEKKRGLYLGGNRHEPPKTPHQWRVMCLDLGDGRELWQHTVHEARPPSPCI